MNGDKKKGHEIPGRLADVFAEDVLNMSDADILAEFLEMHGDPDIHAHEMRAIFENTVIGLNKRRLSEAKRGVAASQIKDALKPITDIAEARRLLRSVIEKQKSQEGITLAARKESELTDSDILSMIQDLQELGVFPPDRDKND